MKKDGTESREVLLDVHRNLSTSGLYSGAGGSWFDGVNGTLMQQEPDSLKQDYWN
jgi:hypothetical protein